MAPSRICLVTGFCALMSISSVISMPMSLPGFYVSGGVMIREATTLMGCLDACSQTPSCVGLDLFSGMWCFLHTEDTECGSLVMKPGYKHYRFIQCGVLKSGPTIANPPNPAFIGRSNEMADPVTTWETVAKLKTADLLYPYGLLSDQELLGDDASVRVQLQHPLPFFGEIETELFVHSNGYVSFSPTMGTFTPIHFPVLGDNYVMIAPFWADSNTLLNDGRVLYRESTDQSLLDRVSRDVLGAFRSRGVYEFSAKTVFIVTWADVTYYGGDMQTDVNTFQLVLTHDGCKSFAMFNYGELNWSKGLLSDLDAVAGFNTGDGLNFYELPFSGSPDSVNIAESSNIGHPGEEPGRWLLRLDDGQCPSMDTCENYLHIFHNTSYTGAGEAVVPALASAQQCEQWCRATASCIGVTFDSSISADSKCIRQLSTFDASDLIACDTCTYWRKNKCMRKTCLAHDARIAADLVQLPDDTELWVPQETQVNMNAASFPGYDVEECDGSCMVSTTCVDALPPSDDMDIQYPLHMTRACVKHTKAPCEYRTVLDADLGRNVTTTTCVCNEHRCNAMGPRLLDEFLVQYSFDLDFLGYVNEKSRASSTTLDTYGINMKYSYIDSRKNWAAVFDGTSYVLLDKFEEFVGGNLDELPEMTISMWVKLTEIPKTYTQVSHMTLLNNGEHGQDGSACVDIYVEHIINSTDARVVAEVRVQGTVYSLSTVIPYNSWKQLNLQLTSHPWVIGYRRVNYFLQLMVNGEEPVVQEMDVPTSYKQLLIDICDNPLCIGRKCSAQGNPEYFYGLIDEIWIFQRALSAAEVQSLQDITYNSPYRIV